MVFDLKQEIFETGNIDGLCQKAAELIIEAGREAVLKRGRFTLVLTGGGTVQNLYRYLVENASESDLKEIWARTDFFLGDERFVPETDPDSNGAMVRSLLLEPLGVADSRIFMVPTDFGSPEAGAAEYENTLRHFFSKEFGATHLPTFDLVLLSMGSDGHVASLFPGTEALTEKKKWVTTSFPLNLTPAVDRITLTMPVINQARHMVLLVKGGAKKAIARRIHTEPSAAVGIYPASQLKADGRNIWLLADD